MKRAVQASCCAACTLIGWLYTAPIEGTELSGGGVTGRLLDLHNLSGYLFVVGFYFIFPKASQTLLGWEFSVIPTRAFAWNSPAVVCTSVFAQSRR